MSELSFRIFLTQSWPTNLRLKLQLVSFNGINGVEKVKLYLCLIKYHAMKMYKREEA
jgi:hypothetical protein